MIRATALSKRFGPVTAVDGISLDIPRGRVVGLLGPNGAGKSTTVKMLVGSVRPDQGSVLIADADPWTDPLKAASRFGYLPETAPLYTEMTAKSFLRFRASLYGIRGANGDRAIDKAAAACDVTDALPRRIAHLSKGYRQRIALASTLLHDPQVLVLDEPTNGLDPSQVRQTRELIRTLAEGRTVLVSSHILPEIERVCDDVVVIAGGKIRAQGALSDLLAPSGNVRVEWTGDAQTSKAVEVALGALPGAHSAAPLEESQGALLTLRDGADATELSHVAAKCVLDSGLKLISLTSPRETLENVFVNAVDGVGSSAHEAAARNEPAQ